MADRTTSEAGKPASGDPGAVSDSNASKLDPSGTKIAEDGLLTAMQQLVERGRPTVTDEMSFEDLLASPHLQFDLDNELLPHLLTFGPSDFTAVITPRVNGRRPWLFENATSTTVVVSDNSEGESSG